jgi:hypothetical protein
MATQLKTIVVSNPVADFKRRAASMQEIAKALNLLRDNIARVKGVGLIVLLEFGDGVRHRVNCDAGVVDATQVDADCTIAIPAADFIQIVGGGIDPRFLICFQRMKMTGSPRAVTKFLDAIGARQVVSSLLTDRELPRPTTDYDLAKSQIREFGYCFIKDALEPPRLRALLRRLEEQAAAEREIGYATRGTATKTGVPLIQPVWNLVNKGQAFLDLASFPAAIFPKTELRRATSSRSRARSQQRRRPEAR